MDKFTKLLDTLSEIGYEADNMDCMELEYSDGNGFVTFITKDCVQVRLPFTNWELDLNYAGHYLTFERKFQIKSPAIGMGHLDIEHASQEFGIKLKLIVLPDQFIDRMKQASDCLAPITVESII
jgi:hypothetical protein